MLQRKKSSLVQNVERADVAKKVNPLDLSSDQDLTIGLMNLLAIEDLAPDSQIAQMVRDIRVDLMRPIVDKAALDGDVWQVLEQMLASVMSLIKTGDTAQQKGDARAAYDAYDRAYEGYALFWGTVMGMV